MSVVFVALIYPFFVFKLFTEHPFICVVNIHLLASFAGKETLRCLALALKWMPSVQQTLSFDDEKDLTFIGLVCSLCNV
jgi:magnesium-transporting ATPase (P-type)